MAKRLADSDRTHVNITGARIKEARLIAKMTQLELSNKLEMAAVYVCRGSIARIEAGVRTITDIELDAISQALNVSLDYLFGRD